MAEYIEREAAYEKCGWYNTVNGKSIYAATKGELASVPSADVAPVRHGRWVDGKCTVCGWEEPDVCAYDGYEIESWVEAPYCPNCGAKMHGGSDHA